MKVALLLLTIVLPQEPATLLRRSFHPGDVEVYKMEDRVEQTVTSAMGKMPMTLTSNRTYTLRTTAVDDASGVAQFEATTVVDKITADGAAAPLASQKPSPTIQKGKVDVRGRTTLVAVPKEEMLSGLMSGTQGAISAGYFVEFPEKAVKIGDRWEIVVPKSPLLFDRDQRLTETLTGEKVIDGVPVWTVSLTGTLKTLIDGSSLPVGKSESPLAVSVEGQDDLLGEGLIEKSTGRTLRMTIQGVSKRTIKLLDSGLTLQVEGKVDSKIELEKPKG